MDNQNARHVSYFGGAGPGRNLGNLKPEMATPAEWDQLLAKLALNDSQALEAVKSDREDGEQLRRFVSRFLGHHFVPEAVIEAVRHHSKEKRPAILSASQSTAANSDAVAA